MCQNGAAYKYLYIEMCIFNNKNFYKTKASVYYINTEINDMFSASHPDSGLSASFDRFIFFFSRSPSKCMHCLLVCYAWSKKKPETKFFLVYISYNKHGSFDGTGSIG